jgi:hypothetical protein
MPSLESKPTSISLFPTTADRSTLTNAHQQYYLSPPLTPYLHFPTHKDNSDSNSPPLSSYHPTLPALQEMLPNESQQKKFSDDVERFQQRNSASQQRPERERNELIEHNSIPTYASDQHPNDPARLVPLYSAHPHNIMPQSSNIIAPLLRRNKAHVASACVNCKKAHLACDGKNPPTQFLVSVYP